MRNSRFLFAAFSFLFFFSANAKSQEQINPNDSERQLFDSLNHERTAQGLSPLQWDRSLFKAARKHALLMLNLNSLEHQLPNEPALETRLAETGARFTAIAENIAVGANPLTIHDGWMHSPGHRKNILNPQTTSVGIAAVRGPGGLFAVEDFSQSVPELSVEQQEQKVSSYLTAKGYRTVASGTAAARRTCEKDSAFADSGARAVVQFEAADLDKLPAEVEQKINSREIGKAAVGACHANSERGFTRFRIAVLFF
jgi:hypothetical protein